MTAKNRSSLTSPVVCGGDDGSRLGVDLHLMQRLGWRYFWPFGESDKPPTGVGGQFSDDPVPRTGEELDLFRAIMVNLNADTWPSINARVARNMMPLEIEVKRLERVVEMLREALREERAKNGRAAFVSGEEVRARKYRL